MTGRIARLLIIIAGLVASVAAQSGGGFEITEAVIAGGGASSADGNFTLDSTFGQPAAGGALSADPFAVTSGFWNYTVLTPTAAQATISGQVRTADGVGISGAVLYLQTQSGEIYATRSASFGYYMFEEIAVGQSVFLTVEHKRFIFEPRSVMLIDSVTGLDFVPQ